MNSIRDNVTIQGIGGGVAYVNQLRADQLSLNLKMQDMNLDKALGELNKAREFLGTPEHILGSTSTKHGEVAEVFDVRFGNADRIIRGEDPIYSFEGVGRTAPEDYLKNNLPVQSKFVQSNLSMDAIIKHLNDYPDFVSNGGSYCIPKDYYEQIQNWMKLSPEELSKLPAAEGGRLARNVVERVREIEAQTGKSFSELIEPSQLEYNQVQLNRANGTLDQKEQEILKVDESEREKYWEMSKASVEEGFKAAGIAAAISGVISFTASLISILKSQNKKITDLTKEDWEIILKETGIGALKGGISGGGIYALTNVAGMSAPLAAALVSATLGVATQAIKLYKKEISFDDFMYSVVDVAVEAAVSAVGAFVGQITIPVPGLGSIIGSIVATTVLHLIKKHLFGGGYYELVKQAHYEKAFSDEYKPLVETFEKAYNDWSLIEQDISRRLRPIIAQGEQSFSNKVSDLHNYIEGI